MFPEIGVPHIIYVLIGLSIRNHPFLGIMVSPFMQTQIQKTLELGFLTPTKPRVVFVRGSFP